MLIRHHAVRKDKHVGACRQKRQTRCRATNYGCWGAIVPSEKTNTLARAVRKDRHIGAQPNTDADAPSCRQKRLTRWRVPSEKTDTFVCNELPMLICHHAVRKDKYIGLQRITDAAAPSHRQKRQTRKSRTESDIPRVADKIWSLKQCAFIVWCRFLPCLSRLQQASRCASKKNVASCLFYSPPTQPSIGCNSDSKIRTRDSNTSVEPLPAAPHIYLSIYLSVCQSVCLSIYPSIYLSV